MDPRAPKFGELPHAVREHIEAFPDRWRDWREQFRQDPVALLRHPATRVVLMIAGGVVFLAVVGWLVRGLAPAGANAAEEATPWSVLYVACSNPKCVAESVVKQPRGFKDWPLTCPKCGQKSVYRATQCEQCGHWYAVAPGQPNVCPHCAAKAAAQQTPRTDDRPKSPTNPDNAEDAWGP